LLRASSLSSSSSAEKGWGRRLVLLLVVVRGGRGRRHLRRVVEAGGVAPRRGVRRPAAVVVGAHLAEEEVLGAEQLARLVLGLGREVVHGVFPNLSQVPGLSLYLSLALGS